MAQDNTFGNEDGDEIYIRDVWANVGPGKVLGDWSGRECWIIRADGTVVYQESSGVRRLATIVTAEDLRDPGSVWERVSAEPDSEPETTP